MFVCVGVFVELYSAVKRNTDTRYNMDEPRKHYTKWKKLDTKGHI